MKISHLSVVVPVYNQAHCIAENLSKILDFLKKNVTDYEVIVVDDGSTDATPHLLKRFKNRVKLLRNNPNKGKGYAVKRGLLSSTKSWALFIDSDLSIPIEVIPKLWEVHQANDVILASRAAPGAKILGKKPLLRIALGKLFPCLVQLFVLPGIRDTQCGCKLFNRKAMQTIFKYQTIHRFGFDVEVLLIAKKHSFRLKEVGIVCINSETSTLNPFTHALQMFLELVRIKLNDWAGKYD